MARFNSNSLEELIKMYDNERNNTFLGKCLKILFKLFMLYLIGCSIFSIIRIIKDEEYKHMDDYNLVLNQSRVINTTRDFEKVTIPEDYNPYHFSLLDEK